MTPTAARTCQDNFEWSETVWTYGDRWPDWRKTAWKIGMFIPCFILGFVEILVNIGACILGNCCPCLPELRRPKVVPEENLSSQIVKRNVEPDDPVSKAAKEVENEHQALVETHSLRMNPEAIEFANLWLDSGPADFNGIYENSSSPQFTGPPSTDSLASDLADSNNPLTNQEWFQSTLSQKIKEATLRSYLENSPDVRDLHSLLLGTSEQKKEITKKWKFNPQMCNRLEQLLDKPSVEAADYLYQLGFDPKQFDQNHPLYELYSFSQIQSLFEILGEKNHSLLVELYNKTNAWKALFGTDDRAALEYLNENPELFTRLRDSISTTNSQKSLPCSDSSELP